MPTTVVLVPWPDPMIDTIGHDPRSRYAERFWLPVLGPMSLILLRHLADKFDTHPDGVQLEVAETSMALGVGQRDGTSSPMIRSLGRLEQFDLACTDPRTPTIAVRRNVPPLSRRRVARLPADLQAEHRDWAEARLGEPVQAEARRRARRLALVLLEQGGDPDHAERVLASTGFHPAVSADARRWAVAEHRDRVADGVAV